MRNKYLLLLLVILGLFLVFKDHEIFQSIIYNVDSPHGINSLQHLTKNFYAWNEDYNGGSYTTLFTIPTMLVGSFFNILHTSISNPIVLIFLAFSLWFVAYKLTLEVLEGYCQIEKNEYSRLLTAVSSTFIISNELVRGYFITNTMIVWSLLFSGIGILFFLKYIKSKKIKHVVYSVLSIMFSALSFHLIILSIIFCIILWFLFDIVLADNQKISINKLTPIIIFITLISLTNAYWITNALYDFSNHNGVLSSFTSSKTNTDNVLNYTNTYDNKIYFNSIFSAPSNYDWYPKDISIFLVVDSYLILGLSYFSFFFISHEKKNIIKKILLSFWVIFALLFYLALGPKGPGGIFMLLWQKIPGFQIFRSFFKFEWLIFFILPSFVAYSSIKIFQYLKKYKNIFLISIVILFISRFIPYIYLKKELTPITIPQSYNDLYKYLDSVGNKDTILIAPVFSWTQKFKWSNQYQQVSDPLAISFLNNPVYVNRGVYLPSRAESTNIKLIYDLVDNGECFRYLAGIRSIGLVIIRSDIVEKFAKQANISTSDVLYNNNIESQIDKESGLHKIKSFGDLALYGLDEKYKYPMVFLESDSNLSINETHCLENISNKTKNITQTSSSQNKKTIISETNKSYIEYIRNNPTLYEVKIHKANNDINIVLNQSFDNNWIIETNNNISLNNIAKHFIANGYANGWKLNINDLCKVDKTCQFNNDGSINVSLKIEFLPQRIFKLGVAITAISIFICLLFLLTSSQKLKTPK